MQTPSDGGHACPLGSALPFLGCILRAELVLGTGKGIRGQEAGGPLRAHGWGPSQVAPEG